MSSFADFEKVPLEELREQVLEGLVRRYTSEAVTMEEYERRTAVATRAATRSELLAAVEGLPAEGSVHPAPALRPSSALSGWKTAAAAPAKQGIVAIFSGAERRGAWKAPKRLESLCVFGGAELDFRKAVVPPEGVTITALAIFGGVDIIVPPDMRVEVAGMGIFGGFDHRQTEADESAPLIRVEGLAIFGGVGIKIRS